MLSYAFSNGACSVVQHRLFGVIMGGGSAARRLGGYIYSVEYSGPRRLLWDIHTERAALKYNVLQFYNTMCICNGSLHCVLL